MNGALLVSKQRFTCLARQLPQWAWREPRGSPRRGRRLPRSEPDRKDAEPEQSPRSLSSGDSRALLKLRPLRGTRGCRRRLRISVHRKGVSHLCIIHSWSLRIAPSFDGGIVFACKSLPIFSHFIYFLVFTTFLTFQNSFKSLLPSFYLKKKMFLISENHLILHSKLPKSAAPTFLELEENVSFKRRQIKLIAVP